MTRVVTFFVATLVAASLGVVAEDKANPAIPSSNQVTQAASAAQQSSAARIGSPEQTAKPAGSNDSPTKATTAAADSGVQDAATAQETGSKSNAELPQTSTILPLLGLIGLGSLVAGFFARR